MWLDRHMAASDNTHVWNFSVPASVAALSTTDAVALVLGSTFARRMRAQDPEHGSRLCDHGRLLFQACSFCESGVPAMPDTTWAEQRENARRWMV